MRRIVGYAMLGVLALPVALHAQKPSNSMHTRSAEIYLDRARQAAPGAEQQELLQKALEVLMEGAASDAGNPKIWFMVGQTYTRMGDAAGADSAFDRAESIYPDYAAEIEPERLNLWITLYNQGIAALQAGDHATAMARLQQADDVYRGRAEAVLLLGSIRMQEGDLPGAEQAFRTALEITQGPAAEKVTDANRADWMDQERDATERLASLLSQLGRNDDAIAVYRRFLDRHPDSGEMKAAMAATLASAGRADEAAKIYQELLDGADLSDVAWFNAGVRLYSADQPELAARAFRKSTELNPYSRDGWFNLGQALFAVSNMIETEREAAPDAEKAAFDSRLAEVDQELYEVAEKVREFDPAFRNGLMMQAQALRDLGETMTDEAQKKEAQDRLVALLEEADQMPFEVSGVQYRIQPDGGVTVSGQVTNHSLPAGQPVNLVFTLLGESGETVATENVTLTAGEPDSRTPFDFRVETDANVLGWKYAIGS